MAKSASKTSKTSVTEHDPATMDALEAAWATEWLEMNDRFSLRHEPKWMRDIR